MSRTTVRDMQKVDGDGEPKFTYHGNTDSSQIKEYGVKNEDIDIKPFLEFYSVKRSKVLSTISKGQAEEADHMTEDMDNIEEVDCSELFEQFMSMDEDEDVPYDLLAIPNDQKASFIETVVHTGEESGDAVNTSSSGEEMSAVREEPNE
ncbi:hypothetical protein BWQ96_03655 [Gracilariopsis chorda]|uniref:Uncharacterized protein n=1 Tax=Gracilariopsis chorda TaxID=448386 RepID=A0A2V3IWY6_9FLOR|nr:hypothetical protein BWQ96_03655 [Gracilariopsis chorda]|eukprot:PXF46666.1 hypothetical protein BWQ96_03655 [Gracilariopsis chorda]